MPKRQPFVFVPFGRLPVAGGRQPLQRVMATAQRWDKLPPDQLPPLKLIRSWSATQQVDFKKRRMKYWCAPNPSDSVRPCQRDCSFSSRSRCPEPWIAELFPCL